MVGSTALRIGKADAKNHLVFVERALHAAGDAQRDEAIAEGFARFGMRFGTSLGELARLEQPSGPFNTLNDQSIEIVLRWLGGERFTPRADDDERRLAVADELLAMSPGEARIAGIVARAIVALPEGHKQRDEARARTLFEQRLAAARTDGDASSFLSAAIDLLEHRLVDADAAVGLYEEARTRLPLADEPLMPRRLDTASP